jgi:hypothetical protein
MRAYEVKIPDYADMRSVEFLVQEASRARGLVITMKTTLKSYPGSIHWHLKKGDQRGTLEATFWKQERRLWLAVHSNRTGDWTRSEALGLKASLEREFKRGA